LSLIIGLNIFIKNLWKCESFSYRRLVIGEKTLDDFVRKLQTTSSIEHTVMIDFKMCCLYVVLVLRCSVETCLGWSGKFC